MDRSTTQKIVLQVCLVFQVALSNPSVAFSGTGWLLAVGAGHNEIFYMIFSFSTVLCETYCYAVFRTVLRVVDASHRSHQAKSRIVHGLDKISFVLIDVVIHDGGPVIGGKKSLPPIVLQVP